MKYVIKKVAEEGDDVKVDAREFDAVLKALLNSKPETFREVVARPKFRKDGGIKRSAKRAGRRKPSGVSC